MIFAKNLLLEQKIQILIVTKNTVCFEDNDRRRLKMFLFFLYFFTYLCCTLMLLKALNSK